MKPRLYLVFLGLSIAAGLYSLPSAVHPGSYPARLVAIVCFVLFLVTLFRGRKRPMG